MNGASRRRLLEGALVVALLLGGAAYLLPLRPCGLMINDDGWYLHPTLRMLHGEILYRDVWTFYAPLEYHALAALFRITGPSILVARTWWVGVLLLAIVGTYAVARRLAPPGLAWLPAAVFGLVPGQWSKGFYSLCTVAFFVALHRLLERQDGRRAFLLGLVAGTTLVTRQDIGVLQLGLAGGAVLAPALLPVASGRPAAAPWTEVLRWSGAFAVGWLLPVSVVVGYYAMHGALGPLLDATLVRAVVQRKGWYAPGLGRLLSPDTFLRVAEGRAVGVLMLLPPLTYFGVGVVLLRRALRRSFDRDDLFVAALVLYAAAGLLNTFYQMRLLRLLETGVPFYLTVTWAVATGARALSQRLAPVSERVIAAASGLASSALATAFVGTVLFVVPHILPSEDYSGSIRMRRFDRPVTLLHDTVRVDFALAEEIRLVRQFIWANVPPGTPIFAAPLHSLYYVILARPNPTRVVAIHFRRDRILTEGEKEREMARLLGSGARFALADSSWLAWPEPPDEVRRTLLGDFHPVREYGSLVVLERGAGEGAHSLSELYPKVMQGRAGPEDVSALEALARDGSKEPLAWLLLGRMRLGRGRVSDAVRAFEEAARLDPSDPSPLEQAALLLIETGRQEDAAPLLRRALAVRDSPAAQALLAKISVESSPVRERP